MLPAFVIGALSGLAIDRPGLAVVFLLFILAATVVAFFAVWAGRALWRPSTTYVLTGSKGRPEAFLVLTATRCGWQVSGHVARAVGEELGRTLRGLLVPELVACADDDDRRVVVLLTAATDDLATTYAKEIPGLRPTGRDRTGQLEMRREPGDYADRSSEVERFTRRRSGSLVSEQAPVD